MYKTIKLVVEVTFNDEVFDEVKLSAKGGMLFYDNYLQGKVLFQI